MLQTVDLSIKKEIWIQARDSLKDYLLNQFFPKINFAIQLDQISKNVQNDHNDNRELSIYELATTYIKLERLGALQDDAFKFMSKLFEFTTTTQGRAFLHKDINAKFVNIVNNWLGNLHYCKYGNCIPNCNCFEDWFSRAMGRISKDGYTFEKLTSENIPAITLRNKLFGVLINRTLGILHEIDRNLPSFENIYNTDSNALLNLLIFSKINFQISYRDGYLFVNIDGQRDKLGSNRLRQEQLPHQKSNQFFS